MIFVGESKDKLRIGEEKEKDGEGKGERDGDLGKRRGGKLGEETKRGRMRVGERL